MNSLFKFFYLNIIASNLIYFNSRILLLKIYIDINNTKIINFFCCYMLCYYSK